MPPRSTLTAAGSLAVIRCTLVPCQSRVAMAAWAGFITTGLARLAV